MVRGGHALVGSAELERGGQDEPAGLWMGQDGHDQSLEL